MVDLVTVFTPTYNRGYTLERLFDSLQSQTSKNFEWVIVDDGSTDNTELLVNTFIEKADFKINYCKKVNQGKYIAINLGLELAKGIWFFIVDSDDYLTNDAIEKINYYCNQIKGNTSFAGVVGLKGNSSGETWENYYNSKIYTDSEWLKKEYFDANCIEYRFKKKISGDRAEVVRTEILKKFKFPEIKDVKFMSEGYIWLSIANEGYKFRWFNKVIYIAEYIEDGLSHNIRKIYKENWKSACFINNFCLDFKGIPMKIKMKNCVNYFRYGIYGGVRIRQLYKECRMKIISLPCIIIAIIKKVR